MHRFLVGVAVFLAACSQSPTDSDRQLRIDLEGSRFSSGEPITASIENASGEDVIFFHCGHRIAFAIERREGNSWTTAFRLNGPICPAVLPSGAMILSPGEVHSEQFSTEAPGEYRIRAEFGKGVVRIGYTAYSSRFWVE